MPIEDRRQARLQPVSHRCPVCKMPLSIPMDELQIIICERCGTFRMESCTARRLEEWRAEEVAKLSAYIKTSDQDCVDITEDNIEGLRSEFANHNIEEKQVFLLQFLQKRGPIGATVEVCPDFDWPSIWAESADEFNLHLDELTKSGFIRIEQTLTEVGKVECRVTVKGLRFLEDREPVAPASAAACDSTTANAMGTKTAAKRTALGRTYRSLPLSAQWIFAIVMAVCALVGAAVALIEVVPLFETVG